jgi:alpha-galactosidase
LQKSYADVSDFYKDRQGPKAKTEKEILVITVDGKGVVMRKDQIQKKNHRKRFKKIRKLDERKKKDADDTKKVKPGKKKVSTVIGVYTIAPRTAGDFLKKEEKWKKATKSL